MATTPFDARIGIGVQTIEQYYRPELSARALAHIPPDVIIANDIDETVKRLMAWFNKVFFKWCHNPVCDFCSAKSTKAVGMAAQLLPEEKLNGAGRVEVYLCEMCGSNTRFPRYNNPGRLLETRRGRCGEWANCFALCCVAVGAITRYVLDWTDHVWVEYYSPALRRYVHLDPCENAYDKPLLYEQGWKKKLSYLIAFERNAIVDVSRRYSVDVAQLLPRRTDTTESQLVHGLKTRNAILQMALSPADRAALQQRLADEEVELVRFASLGMARVQQDQQPLEGRQSGDEAWRQARGEWAGPSKSGDAAAGGGGAAVVVELPFVEFSHVLIDGAVDGENMTMHGSCTLMARELGSPVEASVIELTPARGDCVGACWVSQSVSGAALFATGFEATFFLRIQGRGADGAAFVVRKKLAGGAAGSGGVAVGTGGCELGFGGISHSVAVEFDTYENRESAKDASGNHIAIMSRGKEKNSADHSVAELAVTHDIPVLNSGEWMLVNVTYVEDLCVMWVCVDGYPILSVEMNLKAKIGAGSADQVEFGFTAATGGLNQSHQIHSFSLKY